MSQDEVIRAGSPMPIVSQVAAHKDNCVEVHWASGPRAGKVDLIDLSAHLHAFKLYRRLLDNDVLFSTVRVIDEGNAIAWDDDDELEMPATALERLAEETMSADEFRAFISEQKLTHSGIAALLGYGRRQIESFLSGSRPIPKVVALACIALRARGVVQRKVG